MTHKQTTKITLITLALAGVMMFAGCEGKFDDKGATMQMIAGTEYLVLPGDRVTPGSDETNITVRHVLSTDQKYVTLRSGDARLIRGDAIVTDERTDTTQVGE